MCEYRLMEAVINQNSVGVDGVEARPSFYRPDIDGLRAIAVIAVVLYHLDVPVLGYGFAGVDIFFVISGFVIASTLRRELRAGTFSIRHFYERRIRRIFPALVTVLIVSAVIGWLVLPPPDIVRLGHSLGTSALFTANLYFLGQGSYYAPAARSLPLLHIWSLSVEEQFYLVFPWLLLACHVWFKSRYVVILAILAAVSFAMGIWLASHSAAAAFYLSAARAWELLLGCMLAFAPKSAIRTRWVLNVCGLGGVALIAAAISGQPIGAVSIGIEAVLACLGASLVIFSGGRSGGLVSAALSSRPLVFIGLISYSLYLWHWPVLIFARTLLPSESGNAFVVAASLVLATASWRFVEQPARKAQISRRQVFRWAGAATVFLLLVAIFFSATRGGAWRFSPHVQWLYSFDGYEAKDATRENQCFLTPRRRDPALLDRKACLSQTAGKPNYLLVGDSHAAHLWFGLAHALPEIAVQQATASGCRPLLYGLRDPQCERFLDDILKSVVPAMRPDGVILAGRWSEPDLEPLRRTIAVLPRTVPEIIVLGPAVEYREALPHVLALAERRNDPSLIDRARLTRPAEVDEMMRARLQGSGAKYISVYRALCPLGQCLSVTPTAGVPLQFDYGHFTREGSIYVGEQLRASILQK